MKYKKTNIILLFIMTFALLSAILFEKVTSKLTYGEKDIQKFRNSLFIKEDKLIKALVQIIPKLSHNDPESFFAPETLPSSMTKDKYGLDLFIYYNDTISYWSTNLYPVHPTYSQSQIHDGIVFLGNTWCYVRTYKINNYDLVGIIKIKSEYPYENNYLRNVFNKGFYFPSDAIISTDTIAGFQVNDLNGNYLFSVEFPELLKQSPVSHAIVLILYALSFVFILIIIRNFIFYLASEENKKWGILLAIFVLTVLRWLMLRYQFPNAFYSMELFSPINFAASNFLPSLGDFFINSIIFLFIIYLFYYQYHIEPNKRLKQKVSLFMYGAVYLAMVTIYFEFISYLFKSLMLNSDISFEAHKIIDINIYSFFGLFSIALHFIAFIFICDKFFKHIKEKIKLFPLLALTILVLSITQFTLFVFGLFNDLITDIFLVAVVILLLIVRYGYSKTFQFSRIVLLVFLFAVYSAYFILNQSKDKTLHEKKVLAVNLATEHDPIAELLIEDAENTIKADTAIYNQLYSDHFDYDVFLNYLRNRHLAGYLEKFDVQVTICDPYQAVLIEPDFETFHCYTFFDELIKNIGIRVPGTNFFYLDHLNGRISYLGYITFENKYEDYEKTLFIQLDSKLVSEEIGYPELMLDDATYKPDKYAKYSYAKYFKNKLVTHSGIFKYSLEKEFDKGLKLGEFQVESQDGFNHLIHKVDMDNFIIISNPSLKTIDALILFSYIFAFYLILITIAVVIINFSVIRLGIQPSFKNRIQYTLISVLLLSLLFIGTGTIILSISQYKTRNSELLREKMQSVYIELMHKLEFEKDLTSEWYSDKYGTLDDLLRKFSNVFYTDINLYDANGNLLATSRPEVFKKGLMGALINPDAHYQLIQKKKAEWIHNEKIGQMEYLSAYVPFVNSENSLLAYLNLPYFIKQEPLASEVYALVIAMVNIYVLLIMIAVTLAIIMSNQITQPLRLIQKKIGEIRLGKESEKIEYERKDEIAGLINDYNRVVDELQNSAELLARSERESAWREMAKQIAHEIKNPLTPMRLSVQYLQKTWREKGEISNEYIEKFAHTLIEQIDSLSAIASEFSNFAKLPQAKFVKINLTEKLQNIVGLFENSETADVKLILKDKKPIYILADKEQLARVFINIIKNAIQSVPPERRGLVEVRLDVKDNEQTIISIKDNGNGIAEEMKTKLFIPNFTTKTSGMGLGLAITKNIVEQADGTIYYETEQGKGTIFFVELPLYKKLDDIKPEE